MTEDDRAGDPALLHAAGIMFIAAGKVLLVQRSDVGDASGLWAFPGGAHMIRPFLGAAVIAAILTVSGGAMAQTACPQQSTPQFAGGGTLWGRLSAQVNQYFAAKADASNGTLCNPTITGTLNIPSSAVTNALGYTPLNPANNLSELTSPTTAQANLGLGGLATLGIGSGLSSNGSALSITNFAAPSHQVVTGYSSGWLTAQLGFGDLSGSIAGSQIAGGTTTAGALNLGAGLGWGNPWLDVRQSGAKCDGTTDDAAAINAAVTAAEANGGAAILLPPGKTCAVGSTIAVSSSMVGFICGNGSNGTPSGSHQSGISLLTACEIKWIGASGGTIMSFIAPTGSTTDGFLDGNFLSGIWFNGNSGLAADAVHWESVRGGRYQNLYAGGFNGGAVFDLDVVHATPSNFGDACDSRGNIFAGLFFDQNGFTSSGVHLGSWLNASILDAGCNASENTFVDLIGTISNNDGVVGDGDDNNVFLGITDIYTAVGGTGHPFHFQIHSNDGLTYPSNDDYIQHLTSGASVYVDGQTADPLCTAYAGTATTASCPFGIAIDVLDESNATPFPTVEAGAQAWFGTSDGKHFVRAPQPSLGSCSGLGSTGSCALAANSENGVGIITLTVAGTSPGASGAISVTFSYPPGSNSGGTACDVHLMDNSQGWPATSLAVLGAIALNTGFQVNWATNGSALAAGTYNVTYQCAGF